MFFRLGLQFRYKKKRQLSLLFCFTLLTLVNCVSAQQVFYVSKLGDNSKGTSWQSAWRELDQINWRMIDAGATLYLDGGTQSMTYTSTLTVEKKGREDKPINIKLSQEAGRNGQVIIFGGRDVDLPYCGQASFQDSKANLRTAGIVLKDTAWINIDGTKWRGISIHGHNGSGIELEKAKQISLKNIEVFNNGSIKNIGASLRTDAPGIRLSGHAISIERAIIYDNGQDALQAENLSDFSLSESWLYNSRAHPSVTTESWNYCTHTDGLQVYNGGELHNFLIENSFIGPGFTNGVILGQTPDRLGNRAVVSNVTLRDTVFSKMAENAISSYPNTQPKSWTIERVTAFCENTKFHCLSLEGQDHRVRDSIFYGSGLTLPKIWLENTNNCYWATIGESLGELREPTFSSVIWGDIFAKSDDYRLLASSDCQARGSELTSVAQLLGLTAAFFSSPSVASWEAEAGELRFPFEVNSGYLSQPIELSDLVLAGRASYSFSIAEAGDYVISALVDAPSDASNSFFVNINEEPLDPISVWDVEVTQGFEERLVSWRGQGSFDANEFSPKVFHLEAGEHSLIVIGREANARLDKLAVIPFSTLIAQQD